MISSTKAFKLGAIYLDKMHQVFLANLCLTSTKWTDGQLFYAEDGKKKEKWIDLSCAVANINRVEVYNTRTLSVHFHLFKQTCTILSCLHKNTTTLNSLSLLSMQIISWRFYINFLKSISWRKKNLKQNWLPLFWNKIKTHKKLTRIFTSFREYNTSASFVLSS